LLLYDVAVIGGGPVGSQAAYRIADAGHSVIVIEKKSRTGEPVCCTGIISYECANKYNLNDGLVTRRLNGARLIAPSGRILTIWRRQTQACVLKRSALDMHMVMRAKEAGAQYLMGYRASDIEITRDFVRIVIGEKNDQTTIIARCLIVANGSEAKLIDGLGLQRNNDLATGVQAEVETKNVDEVEVYLGRRIAPGFFAWLVPTSNETGLAGLLSRQNARDYLREMLISMADRGKIKSSKVEISSRPIPLQSLRKTFMRRAVIIGSSAGQVKPLTGGGIYYGMLCADIAADILHPALVKDDLSAGNLASYDREWRKQLGEEIKTSRRGRKLFERLNDGQINKVFEIAEASGIVKSLLEMEDVSFDWHSHTVNKLIKERVLTGIRQLFKAPFSQ
jgi:digeranylgeranylglycerophospholipid reductase